MNDGAGAVGALKLLDVPRFASEIHLDQRVLVADGGDEADPVLALQLDGVLVLADGEDRVAEHRQGDAAGLDLQVGVREAAVVEDQEVPVLEIPAADDAVVLRQTRRLRPAPEDVPLRRLTQTHFRRS